jgi:hypothetical protein
VEESLEMKYSKRDHTFVIRLERGEEILESLERFCEENRIKSGFFRGIGALKEAELGLYSLKEKKYWSRRFEQPLEITNLTGNISMFKGKPFIHCHATLADKEMRAFGGHLKQGIVSPTCEIFLTEVKPEILRKKDEETGLNLLDI